MGMLLMRGEVNVNEMPARKAEVAAIAVAVEGLGRGLLGLLVGTGVWTVGGLAAEEEEFPSFTVGPLSPKSSRVGVGSGPRDATARLGVPCSPGSRLGLRLYVRSGAGAGLLRPASPMTPALECREHCNSTGKSSATGPSGTTV